MYSAIRRFRCRSFITITVIQQVPSATADPTLSNAVLPRTTKSGAYRRASHLSRERHHVVAKLRVTVEQQETVRRRVRPSLSHLLHDPKCTGVSRYVEAES